ncbi:MAG: OmpA family protein [Flavobacteriales bacterium]
MNFVKISVIALTSSLLLSSCAGLYIKSGKTAYQDLKYQEAITYLEKGLAKKEDETGRKMLAESYLRVNNFQAASEQYSKVALSPSYNDDDRMSYGKALMSVGQYSDARTIFEGIISRDASNNEAADLLQSCKKIDEMRADSLLFSISPVNIPSENPVYSAVKYNGGLLVTSSSAKGDKDPYTSRAFTDLFTTKSESGTWTALVPLENVNSKNHDAVAAVSPNGQTMIFTRSFQLKNALSGNDKDESPTQLYQSKLGTDGKWSKPEILPFCDVKYMYAHPTFSSDGTTIYFASDMPGSIGGMDIFQSKLVDGSFGLPTNLGTDINTKGDEIFPSLKDDKTLYFSSDAHKSLGGLDIQKTSYVNGAWGIPQHLSYPLNTSSDDFSIIFNEDGKTGYLSSDRSGTDRIYVFEILDPKITIEGLVTSKESNLPLGGAKIIVKDLTTGEEKTYFSDAEGKFNIPLQPNHEYQVKTELDGYFGESENISTKGITQDIVIKKVVEMPQVIVTPPVAENNAGNNNGGNKNGDTNNGEENQNGGNQGSNKNGKGNYPVPNIYWDYNKWEIRADAVPYLDQLVKLFRDNQNLKFEIQSHSDSRGSLEFNDDLSEKRAKAVVEYLITRGVPRSIIISKGYGERQLLNECADGVMCDEEKHQVNRRTEFIVTDKKK